MPHSNPALRPAAQPRSRTWAERAVVLLLFAGVPVLMVGYLLYRQADERQGESDADQPPFGLQTDAPPPTVSPAPPVKWVPRDPPPLELPAAPPPAGERIAYVRPDGDGVRVVTTAGEFVAGLDGFDADYMPSTVRLSRDRTRLAVVVGYRSKEADLAARGVEPFGATTRGAAGEVLVYDLARPGPPVTRLTSDHRFVQPVWGGDADTLYVEQGLWDAATWMQTTEQMRYDLRTGRGTRLDLPDRHVVADVSADGKTLLVNHTFPVRGRGWRTEGYLAVADTLRLTRLSTGGTRLLRLAPDGKRAVGVNPPDPWQGRPGGLVLVGMPDGREQAIKLGDDTLDSPHALWSPDGTKLAVFRRVALPGTVRQTPPVTGTVGEVQASKPELLLRDPDGANPAPFPAAEGVIWFDWR